jgi:hypothetical protein
VRQRCGANGLGKVVDVPPENDPLLAEVSMASTRDSDVSLTPMSSAGSVAITASAKNSEMTLGGLLGSGRKMWWISGFFP